MKKNAKKVFAEAERLGWTYDRTNSKTFEIWTDSRGQEVVINPGCDDNTARQIIRSLQRMSGAVQAVPKRDAQRIKERQAADRSRLADELERYRQRRNSYLAGQDDDAVPGLLQQIEAAILAREEELAQLDRLMRSVPTTGVHSGTGRRRHTTGG